MSSRYARGGGFPRSLRGLGIAPNIESPVVNAASSVAAYPPAYAGFKQTGRTDNRRVFRGFRGKTLPRGKALTCCPTYCLLSFFCLQPSRTMMAGNSKTRAPTAGSAERHRLWRGRKTKPGWYQGRLTSGVARKPNARALESHPVYGIGRRSRLFPFSCTMPRVEKG